MTEPGTTPGASAQDITPDMIVTTIEHALREHDVKAVPGLIKLLATRDPKRAQAVLDTIKAGLALARGEEVEVVIRAKET